MAGVPDPHASEWGACALCGEAFPPNGKMCPTCGATEAVLPGATEALLPRTRRRYKLVRALRVFAVVVVILGLAWATLSGALTGPPTYADPLTTSGSAERRPGNFSVLSGAISGEDYIQGTSRSRTRPAPP